MTRSNRYAILFIPILLVLLQGCESMTGQGRVNDSTAQRLKERPRATARGAGGGASTIVDLGSLPTHVTLAVGERRVISLPSYANSGNTWSATCVRGHGIAQLSVELGESPVTAESRGSGTAEPPPLTLTPEYAVVSGLAKCANWCWPERSVLRKCSIA